MLFRSRKDAEAFGKDLRALRAEKERIQERHDEEVDKAERLRKQSQAQIRLLNEQLENERNKARKAKEESSGHQCSIDDSQIVELKAQHNRECKGLIVQIRYLKAKFSRESLFRDDLGYQKTYLLMLLANFEASDKRILAAISRIGFATKSIRPAPRKRRSFKSVAQSVIFIHRVRRAGDAWRQERACRQAISDALQDVRRRRAINTS